MRLPAFARALMVVVFGLSAASQASAQVDCAATLKDLCEITDGAYSIALPDPDRANGRALIYIHGWGGNAAGALERKTLTAPLLDRGYAVIAPQGLKRGETGPRGWNFTLGPGRRDEPAFISAVADDAAARFGLERDQMIMAGFSIGGSMVHYLACTAPETFAAYAPLAGSFWRPHPEECSGPVNLFHTHGWKDGTFPLEGRRIGDRFQQGDAFETLALWRRANNCRQERARKFSNTGPFMRRAWTECDPGTRLEFALFDGGHVVPKGWPEMVLDWFEGP